MCRSSSNEAGHIQLVERLWPVTHHVLAVGLDKVVVGDTWWAIKGETLSEIRRRRFFSG